MALDDAVIAAITADVERLVAEGPPLTPEAAALVVRIFGADGAAHAKMPT